MQFMEIVDLLYLFRDEFYNLTQEKTSWGKNELSLIMERAISNTLARLVRNAK